MLKQLLTIKPPPRRAYEAIDSWFAYGASDEERGALRESLCALPYRQFLRTFYWRAVKAYVIRRAERKCEVCGVRCRRLEVHHDSYSEHGNEHRATSALR